MPAGRSAPAGAIVLIDGYNVIHQHPQWRGLALAEARRRLALAVANVPWPVPVRRVEVIFDGPDSSGPLPGGAPKVTIAFAQPEADAMIRDRIREASGRVIVISDDREILGTAKSHGVEWHGVTWLLARVERLGPSPGRSHPVGPSQAERRQIDDELKRRWKL